MTIASNVCFGYRHRIAGKMSPREQIKLRNRDPPFFAQNSSWRSIRLNLTVSKEKQTFTFPCPFFLWFFSLQTIGREFLQYQREFLQTGRKCINSFMMNNLILEAHSLDPYIRLLEERLVPYFVFEIAQDRPGKLPTKTGETETY